MTPVERIGRRIRKSTQLYLIILVPFVYILVFAYIPMYGAQIAFKDFIATQGIWGSPFVGLKHFRSFFGSFYFSRTLLNTLGISFYGLVAGFPFPVLLAILLNEVNHRPFKKTVQMVSYLPYFISTVVMVSIIVQVLDPRLGLINRIMGLVGVSSVHFMADSRLFKSIYVWSGIWQGTGYGSIIYLAALSAIDPSLYAAAIVDGATRLQKIWYIDLPGIMPTMMILLILGSGSMLSVGFEKVFLMQNPLNLSSSEVISTYVYKVGLLGGSYSFSTAVSFFNSIVNFLLLVTVNQIARRVGETSLW